MSSTAPDIAIIGASIAGLMCARRLHEAGRSFAIYETTGSVGGRLRTDVVDGFRLDRGFQVFLPGFPEAKKVLDYDALQLRPFYRGAMVHWAGRLQRLSDPLYHPVHAIRSLKDNIVPVKDKWRILLLRKHLHGLKAIPRDQPEFTTEDYLHGWGLSDVFIQHFMRPFFGGVFMDRELMTSSRMFQFLFATSDRGGTAIPALGMQAISDQLAKPLPPQSLRFNHRVVALRPGEMTLESGEVIHAKHIILAVGEANALTLVPDAIKPKPPPMRASTCVYFATDKPMPPEKILYIDGDLRGPVNHACVLTNLAPERAPHGQHLISTCIMGAPSSTELPEVVREQMRTWFGDTVDHWRHLRTYQVPHSMSEARQLSVGEESLPVKLDEGLYRCSDYLEDVSINGALISGRKAAEAVLEGAQANLALSSRNGTEG